MNGGHMRDELVERLTKQLVGVFRECDPSDPKTKIDLEGTMARVRRATDRAEEMSPLPRGPATAAISDEEADAIVAGVLVRLAKD
jgi:hypothetical protein